MKVNFFNQPYLLFAGDMPRMKEIIYSEHLVGLSFVLFWEPVYIYDKIREWHDGKLI